MKNIVLKKIINNFNFSIKQYDNYSASSYWTRSIYKKKKLFNKTGLKNFRKNGLSNNIDDFYISNSKNKILLSNLKKNCGSDFVYRFLQKKNVGNAKKIGKFKKRFYSSSDLFMIKYLNDLQKKVDFNKINIICEIGQGFGLLASKFLKIKKFKIILIDLPESNILTSYFLKSLYPNKKMIMDIDLLNQKLTYKDVKKNDIIIISPWIKIGNFKIDFFINSRSMMEMTKKSINNYFELISEKIKNKGYFLCINRYYKDLVGYPIEFHLYPFDQYWKVLISKTSWMQPFMHFFLVRRENFQSSEIQNHMQIIKKNYLKIIKKDKFLIRRHMPILVYRYYKHLKHFLLNFNK